MRSSIFGTEIFYYKEGREKSICNNLGQLVTRNGFDNFSPEGITSYLTFRYPIGDITMFNGYKKIPCGYSMENYQLERYWYPKFRTKKISFEESLEKTEYLLLESIRKLADDQSKKTAILLSGGIDSSLILALCRTLYPKREIYTYSVGFYGDDEFEYSRLVTKEFKSMHKEVVLSKEDYIGKYSLLRPLIRHKAEPLHPNEIALAYIERMAKRDGCHLVLCGEGSDDIFGGYGQNLRMYLNYDGNKPFFEFFLDNYRYFDLNDRRIVRDEFLWSDIKLINYFMKKDEIPVENENKAFYFIQKFHTPGLIIRGVNAVRFNGLDIGFPYIDKELVEYINSLPFDYKVHWKSRDSEKRAKNMHFREISENLDIPKYILKKLAKKYLPKKIIYRRKYGFPVPFEKWFKELDEWPLNKRIFKNSDISYFSGWKKFMLINLNTFFEIFYNL